MEENAIVVIEDIVKSLNQIKRKLEKGHTLDLTASNQLDAVSDNVELLLTLVNI